MFGCASGRAEDSGSFSQKCRSQSNIFVKKNKNVPCCRRRIGPFIQVNTWSGTDRVTRVSNTRYVVVDPATYCASGRAEETIFFTKLPEAKLTFGSVNRSK